jgi:hypothetical protein
MTERSALAIIGAIALVTSLGASTVTSGLTDSVTVDRFWSAVIAGAITLAAARAGRQALLWLIAISIAVSLGSSWVLAAVLALLVFAATTKVCRSSTILGAVAGAAAAMALLHPAPALPSGLVALALVAAAGPLLRSAMQTATPTHRRQLTIVGVSTLSAFALCCIALVATGFSATPTLRTAVDAARSGITATRNGDLTKASASFTTAEAKFNSATSALEAPWLIPARFVPVLGANLKAARALVDDGLQLAVAAKTSVDAAPYDQIRIVDSGIDLTQITAMQQPVAALDYEVASVQRSVEALDTTWLLPAITSRISDFSEQIDTVAPQLQTASLAMQTLPDMLGADSVRTYLVEFTSESESRFLGGFVGSYALLTADHGKLKLTKSESVATLNRRLSRGAGYIAPAEFKNLYSRFHPELFAQNWSVSPDLPSNARMAEQLFAAVTGVHVNGVIVIDPFGLASLMTLTGPIRVPGIAQQLTATNVADYLLHGQYLEFAGQVDERRDQLAEVAQKAFDELMKSPKTNYRGISRALGSAVSEGHLMFSAFDPHAQNLLDRLGLTRRFTPSTNASLFTFRNSASFANKIDYFLHRNLIIDATIDPHSNQFEADITIELRNDSPASGLPAYVIGNENGEPDGTNGMFFSIYTSGAITSSSLDGEPVALFERPDRGMRVFSKGITIPPGTTKLLRLHLSDTIPATTSGFQLALPHQPMVNDDQLTLMMHSTDPKLVPRSLSGLADASLEISGGVLRATAPITADQTLSVPFGRP